MDYWAAITKRWSRLPDFIRKHRKDPLFLRAYYESRDASRGSYVTLHQAEMAYKKLVKSPEAYQEPSTPSLSPTSVRYFSILHLTDGNKIIGPYTSVNAAHGARKLAIYRAIQKGTARQCEIDWFKQRS